MTRDFKNLPPSSGKGKKKAAPKKAASSKNNGKPSAGGPPGWVWLITGLLLGGLVAFGFFVINRDAYVPDKPAPAPAKIEKSAPPAQVDEEASRFDFYKLLPEQEVVIPDSEIREEQKKIQPPENITYFLQVGSFRKFEQADGLKAQLAFIGVESEIQRIPSNGEDWLRVRVGPFTNKRDLNRVRNRLYRENINSMVVEIKD